MRKVTTYLFFAGSALFLLYACTKTGSSTSIIGNWINRFDADLNGRTNAVSFVIGNYAYVGTGYAGAGNRNGVDQDRFNDFVQYSVDNNSWLQVASMPDSAARTNAIAFSIGTNGYVATGLAQDALTKLADTWVYNSTANTWTDTHQTFAGTARLDAIGFAINGVGYVMGGFDGGYLKDFYSYTPGTGWTRLASFPGSKRRGGSVFVYNNKAYVMGGQDNTIFPSDFWVFDPSKGTGTTAWTQLRSIANVTDQSFDDNYNNIVRAYGTTFIMGTKGYYVTGVSNGGGLMKICWEYDFGSDTWTQKTDFEGGARSGAVSFTLKDRGFVLTGSSGTNYYSDFWEFHPNETYNQYD